MCGQSSLLLCSRHFVKTRIPLALFRCECYCSVLQCDGDGDGEGFCPALLLSSVRAINSTRRATLSAIECEISTTASLVTGSNAKITSEVDMESQFVYNSSWTDSSAVRKIERVTWVSIRIEWGIVDKDDSVNRRWHITEHHHSY